METRQDFDDLGLDDILDEKEEMEMVNNEIKENPFNTEEIFDIENKAFEKPVEAVPVAVNQAVAKPPVMSFDFGELMSIPGVAVGKVGMEISRFPADKARFTTTSKALISFVTDNLIAVKLHYHENVGSYLCFGGKCCDIDGQARIRYVLPIVRYDTDKKGKPVTSQLSYQVLVIGGDTYQALMDYKEMHDTILGQDFLVTCQDEQYQRISLMPAGATRFLKSPSLTDATMAFWEEHMKDLLKPVASPITEEIFLQKLNTAAAFAQTETNNINIDDVFK